LYQYRPFLFAKARKEEKEKKENEHGGEVVEEDGTMDVAGVDSTPSAAPAAAADSTMVDDDDEDELDSGTMYSTVSSKKMVIPPGEIYCAPCHSDGSTAILEKYFDKVDYERSHFTCSRAFVVALLEKHMRLHPKGNVFVVDEDGAVVTGDNVNDGDNPNNPNGDYNKASKTWDDTTMLSRRRSQRLRRLLKNSPRSELWYPHELQAQIMLPNDDQGAMTSKLQNPNSAREPRRPTFIPPQ
jgi:glyoxylase-like metal-dependent hydrolase (beta-lactamase superfamily II)